MSKRVWYRSLYWRIALGLIAFLALMLAAQGLFFIWMTDRIAGSVPARSPRRLAVLVASDLGAALAREPNLDLAQYVRDQYGHVFQPFVVLMRDGRTVANNTSVPDDLAKALRAQIERMEAFARLPPVPRDRDAANAHGPRGGRRRGDSATMVVAVVPAGTVAVPVEPPAFSLLMRALAPTMGLVGGLVLVVGSALTALVVFGPARRRLRRVQEATVRLGAGDLSARAPEGGGDEVSEVARSFNRMAEDLAARAGAQSVRPRPSSTACGRLPRADDAAHGDARLEVDAARTASGGSGLGLSIVKAIIERHGGTIEARNDGGAVFELTLPGVPSEHPDDVLSFSGCFWLPSRSAGTRGA